MRESGVSEMLVKCSDSLLREYLFLEVTVTYLLEWIVEFWMPVWQIPLTDCILTLQK